MARFEMRKTPKGVEKLYICIPSGIDEVIRVATQEDMMAYKKDLVAFMAANPTEAEKHKKAAAPTAKDRAAQEKAEVASDRAEAIKAIGHTESHHTKKHT